MYRQQVPELYLSLEKGTDRVPDDGQYHVLLRGEVIFSSPNAKRAVRVYSEKRKELFDAKGGPPTPRGLSREERMEKERAHRDIQALRIESFERRAAGGRKKGGRGGRGGIP